MSEETMTEVDETTDQEASLEETNAEETSSSEDQEVDYAAELEEQLKKKDKQLSQAEHTIVELKRKKADVGEEDVTDKIGKLIDDRISRMEMALQKKQLDDTIGSMSSSTDEEKLIRYHLDNTVKLTGDIATDVRRAKVLANEKKFESTISELTEAMKSKSTQSAPVMGGSQKEKREVKPELSEADKRLMQKYGLKPEEIT